MEAGLAAQSEVSGLLQREEVLGRQLLAFLEPLEDEFRLLLRVDLFRDFLSEDRKSTRLNSSHSQISYAVFCLKKKKELAEMPLLPRNSLFTCVICSRQKGSTSRPFAAAQGFACGLPLRSRPQSGSTWRGRRES